MKRRILGIGMAFLLTSFLRGIPGSDGYYDVQKPLFEQLANAIQADQKEGLGMHSFGGDFTSQRFKNVMREVALHNPSLMQKIMTLYSVNQALQESVKKGIFEGGVSELWINFLRRMHFEVHGGNKPLQMSLFVIEAGETVIPFARRATDRAGIFRGDY